MRVRQLDLIAFGHFTNRSIDLSQGHYGLHMIYGPNEAGKSSSLRALTSLLFGFPQRTDDNFLHSNKDLRVGATLESRDGKALACVRRKAKTATLLHAESSQELPLALWNQFLPNIQQDQFLRMFGLNHVSLRDGGAELVRGGGDSGQALFSSASGIANLQQKRESLEERIEEIYARSGRRGRLYDKLKDYKALREEEKKVSLTMDHWRRLESQLTEASKQIDDHKTQLDSLQRSLLEAQRIQRSIPTVTKYLDREQAIRALGQLSKLPRDFEDRVQEAFKKKGEKHIAIQGIEAELSNFQMKLAQIPESIWSDEQDLRVNKLISELGLYLQSFEELPKLETQCDQLTRQATQKWQQIGSLDSLKKRLESERIPTSQKKWVDALAKRYETIEKQIADAQLRLGRLRKKLDDDSSSIASKASDESLRLLEQQVHSARPLSSRRQELMELTQDSDRGHKRITQSIQRWKVHVEGIDALAQFPLANPTSIDRWEKELEKRSDAVEKSKSELDAIVRKKSAKQREFERETKKGHVPTRQEWEATKRSRDEVFGLLAEQRQATTQRWSECVQAYEDNKQAADQIAAELLDQADLVAHREQLQQSIDELQAQMDEAAVALEESKNQYRASQQAWQAFLAEHQIAVQSPEEAREWVQAVTVLQREAQDLLDKKHRIEQTASAIQHASVGLIEGLQACGSASDHHDDFDALLIRAESVLRKATEERGKAQAVQKQRQLDQQEHDEQASDLQGLTDQFQELKKQWWEALKAIAIPQEATPLQVQTILEQVSELQQISDQIESTQGTISQCQEQVRNYEAAVSIAIDWLASRHPEALAELSSQSNAESKVRLLESYGKQTSKDKSQRGSFEQFQEQAHERLRKASQELSMLVRELQEMMEIADANSEERLLELARNSREFHLLDSDRKDLRERLQDECNSRDIEPFIEKVRQADADQLAIEIKNLSEQLVGIQQSREQAIKSHSALQRDYDQLDTGGKASMLATQASGIGIEIEESLQELATLRLASAALTAGIERYRSANEDPILKLASESFSQMTLGRFRGIEIALDDAGKHLLVGRRSQEGPGSEVLVEQMSDGTRDQLYLALRLASLQQWNAAHEPMPLVVDDILVHFDDDRSIQTLKQLVQLSDQTQVIFFTHHQHLIELAKESLPADKVFFHELTAG